jgi:hypothetical protein
LQEPKCPGIGTVAHVLDEIHVNSTDTYECVNEFVNRWKPQHNGRVILSGDYSGASYQGTTCTMTNFQVLLERCKKEWGEHKVDLEIIPNPHRIARLNVINAELCNSMGVRRIFFDPKCSFTIDDYTQARIKEGTQDLDKASRDPHHADAVDYRVFCRLMHERTTTKTRRS